MKRRSSKYLDQISSCRVFHHVGMGLDRLQSDRNRYIDGHRNLYEVYELSGGAEPGSTSNMDSVRILKRLLALPPAVISGVTIRSWRVSNRA
jgi:hypothetical protein